jgi:hypothetical protein
MDRLRATASAARSVLDGCEHDGMLDRVGAAISDNQNHQKQSTKGHQKKSGRLITGSASINSLPCEKSKPSSLPDASMRKSAYDRKEHGDDGSSMPTARRQPA